MGMAYVPACHVQGWPHACMARDAHLLKREAQDGDFLAADGVEHGLDDALHKALLLVVVDRHHLPYDQAGFAHCVL